MLRRSAFMFFLGMLAMPAFAQDFPAKPVTIIVPSSPGGISDTSARIIAEGLTKLWGQSVVIENKPGGGGSIGTGIARRAPADGYTLLVTTNGEFALNPVIYPNLPYDPNKDFLPLVMATYHPIVVAANTSTPYKTFKDLADAAKKDPGGISWASAGTGTWNHLAGEWLQVDTGLKLVHVPYKGGGPASTAVAGGDVPIGLLSVSSVMPHLKSGKIRVLAVTSKQKSRYDESWPTVAELGAPELDATNWVAFFAPKDIPADVAKKIETDVIAILSQPEVAQKFLTIGAEVAAIPSDKLIEQIKLDRAQAERITKQANIKVD
ncbi:ABC transporter substrate-binding protein [Hyphomicrobiales bacterium]|nr:ABC transporter substrate-binding protein [Hyphomicrobiales bacterium]CAH1677226.1 ABC transporter substrate-binding protein [Hyphomicrobiales bacterium]